MYSYALYTTDYTACQHEPCSLDSGAFASTTNALQSWLLAILRPARAIYRGAKVVELSIRFLYEHKSSKFEALNVWEPICVGNTFGHPRATFIK